MTALLFTCTFSLVKIVLSKLNVRFFLLIRSSAITGQDRRCGLQEVQTTRICRQLAHEESKVLALRTSRLYPPGDTHGTHLCYIT